MNVKNCTSGIKNMDIKVKNLNISIDAGGKAAINGFPFVEAQVSGENKDSHLGAKMICSSQGAKLRYVRYYRRKRRMADVSDRVQQQLVLRD